MIWEDLMFNSKMKAVLIGLIILLVISACEKRKGSLNPDDPPEIQITSYAGVDNFDSGETQPIVFQQKIFWSASDPNDDIIGYAFRVSAYNEETGEIGEHIATHGYDAIDGEGWVYHYKTGVNVNQYTPPLGSPEAADIQTIWSNQVYAVINFPADGSTYIDDEGNTAYMPVPSVFEVKCIDSYGTESNISSKVFYAQSATPRAVLASDIQESVIGTGTVFKFSMLDNDQYVDNAPREFQFAFLKGTATHDDDGNYFFTPSADDYSMVELDGNGAPVNEDNWDWITTKNEENVEEFMLPSSNPDFSGLSLIPNIPTGQGLEPVEENAVDTTYIFTRVFDIAGLKSEVEQNQFIVYGEFNPGTLMYLKDTFIIGENHYQSYYEGGLGKVIPTQPTSTGVHYSTPFWLNSEGEYEVIGSDDLKLYMHWGWLGEFKSDDPWQKRESNVVDELYSMDYKTEIIYFDIRLDGEPLYYPPVPAIGENLQVDEDGTRWLRVSKSENIFQFVTVTKPALEHASTLYGAHTFEVRAVDLQNRGDETPEVLNFNVVPKITAEEKSGVLIVTDTSTSDDEVIESINNHYESILSEIGQDYEIITRNYLVDSGLHFTKDLLSPTDLQPYKLVIYNQDFEPHNTANIQREYDALYLYLQTGGNFLLTGGKNLSSSHITAMNDGFMMFNELFGVASEEESIEFIGNNMFSKPYFVGADPANGFTTQIDLQLPPEYSTNVINATNGLSAIATFLDYNTSEVLYTYRSKQPGADNFSPAEGTGPVNGEGEDIDPYDGYDEVNGQPIALRYTTTWGNTCYAFGFPLLYMETEDVQNLLTEIMNDLN